MMIASHPLLGDETTTDRFDLGKAGTAIFCKQDCRLESTGGAFADDGVLKLVVPEKREDGWII